MIEQTYAEFSNTAYMLRLRAERFLAKLSDEQINQLNGLVRNELAATSSGKVSAEYDFLAALLAGEDQQRKAPKEVSVAKDQPGRAFDDLPF
ncbi:hypothetical protein [Rhizobium rhizoryzae]|uniref:hypothetical protein n=1 Tax=Rhizobium rhizoryzae TaxID=451876 RepID=UPI0028A29322|nr:hypothetical protein [Rhizobium rhizoryzae]